MKKKNRRDRRAFSCQRQKIFYGNGLLFAFRSSGIEDQRRNEEKTENAEIVP
jgi:hypothetical protein